MSAVSLFVARLLSVLLNPAIVICAFSLHFLGLASSLQQPAMFQGASIVSQQRYFFKPSTGIHVGLSLGRDLRDNLTRFAGDRRQFSRLVDFSGSKRR